jgi:hypothetical protein
MPAASPQQPPQHDVVVELQRVAREIANVQERITASAYDYATVYTAVIIFGGYAGFFAIWQLTKEYLSKDQALSSALLIMASLLSFILFEVYKMVLITARVLAQKKILEDPQVQANPHKLLAALQAMERAQKPSSRAFIVVWAIIVAIALAGALCGTGILAYAFISGLLAEA